MAVKILHWIGITACITLILSCFLPWVYYADINKTFTGFFSEQNLYGRPGRFLVIIAVLVFICMLLPKIWAKRTNLFLSALGEKSRYFHNAFLYNHYATCSSISQPSINSTKERRGTCIVILVQPFVFQSTSLRRISVIGIAAIQL
ncbi:MAG: hypothetical protein HY305_05080 [Sphingobacteriales bacterium]|nr:hypothetical protein [Sphingobacteriales bacterium]